MSTHAFLAPSFAPVWRYCHAAPAIAERYPDLEEGEAAREGTAAHWVNAQLHAAQGVAVGAVAENGVVVTQDMLEGAGVWFQALLDWGDLAPGGHEAKVEQPVTMARMVHPENYGTPDFRRLVGNTLRIRDYKFGHEKVDAFFNYQLIDYAAGALEELGYTYEAIAAGHCNLIVDMGIVQPRNYDAGGPVRRWQQRADQLLPYFDHLKDAAEEATSGSVTIKATPGAHCKYCPGRHACNAVQREAYEAAERSYQSLPVQLSPAALGTELAILERAKALLDARVTGLREQAEHELRRGGHVPGQRMAPGKGKLVWSKPDAEIIALGQMLGVPLTKVSTITPTQAESKGLPRPVLDAYSVHVPGAMRLEADDGSHAKKVFGITQIN